MQPTKQESDPNTTQITISKKKDPKVFRNTPRILNQIPEHIINNSLLNAAISRLPENYNFEIHKTIWKIEQVSKELDRKITVSLQFPEGLLVYSCVISDILSHFSPCTIIIMADVTYGACCVDDFTAKALNSDFLVHYGHSCLVPIDITTIKVLYVFVDIKIDTKHFLDTIKFNFEENQHIWLVSTIQFSSSLQSAKRGLIGAGYSNVVVPQARPLSPGEVLGCTSPSDLKNLAKKSSNLKEDQNLSISDTPNENQIIVYIGDGRFHLESIMISNSSLKAFRYDPYSKVFSNEVYDHQQMHTIRKDAIQRASKAKNFGIILGTLGRQGSTHVLDHIKEILTKKNINFIVLLLSEIFPKKLDLFDSIDAWIQIACPRLSIDWGYAFTKPLLNPYEAEIALQQTDWKENYCMDFYRNDGGPWSVYHQKNKILNQKKLEREKERKLKNLNKN